MPRFEVTFTTKEIYYVVIEASDSSEAEVTVNEMFESGELEDGGWHFDSDTEIEICEVEE